jgi:ABC-type lipoprotein export system ATPase subunit
VIIASHDLTLADHADRSLHLVDGRLVEPEHAPREHAPGRAA